MEEIVVWLLKIAKPLGNGHGCNVLVDCKAVQPDCVNGDNEHIDLI